MQMSHRELPLTFTDMFNVVGKEQHTRGFDVMAVCPTHCTPELTVHR